MPYCIFSKRLQDHWWNRDFFRFYPGINRNIKSKFMSKPELFKFKIKLKHIHFFIQRNKILITIRQDHPLQPGEFGKVTICLIDITFDYILLDRIKCIENKMWVHLCPQCSKLLVSKLLVYIS